MPHSTPCFTNYQLLSSSQYQFYSIRKKENYSFFPFFYLASSLEHDCLSPSFYCQIYQESSLQSLHSSTSRSLPRAQKPGILTTLLLGLPLRGHQKPLLFKPNGLTNVHLLNMSKLIFLLEVLSFLILLILLLAKTPLF